MQQQQQARSGRKELPGGVAPVKPTQPLLGVLELGGGSLQVRAPLSGGALASSSGQDMAATVNGAWCSTRTACALPSHAYTLTHTRVCTR